MKDLSLKDASQLEIAKHLRFTEELLGRVASELSNSEMNAEIWLMPDLGYPRNVQRIHGGFFTGALYTWHTNHPFIPVDATVNCCGVSVFRTNLEITSEAHFRELIGAARQRVSNSSYLWNFEIGNHFIIYGSLQGSEYLPDGHYLVLHSSASEFKKQDNGLYPIEGNWYSQKIKILRDKSSSRYIRYIEGRTAEEFFQVAHMLESYNANRHRYIAGLVLNHNIEEEILNLQHYGMPTQNSIAIGCQWFFEPSMFLLLTAPGIPLFFVDPSVATQNQVHFEDRTITISPHGLGVAARQPFAISYSPDGLIVNDKAYSLDTNLSLDETIQIRDPYCGAEKFDSIPPLITQFLSICPGQVVGTLDQRYSYNRRTAHTASL